MDKKKALDILVKLLDKYPFTEEEKAAIMEAIGSLSWTTLGDSFRKAVKEKKAKERSQNLNT